MLISGEAEGAHMRCLVSLNYPRSLLQIGGVHAPKTADGAKEEGLFNQVPIVTILTDNHHIKKCSFLILSVQYTLLL